MVLAPHDADLRQAAFDFLENAVRREGEALSWSTLNGRFYFRGELVKLVAPSRGIHKPRQLDAAPLTIVTSPPKPGQPAPYEDGLSAEGLLEYHYQGNDPDRYDNEWLRTARRLQLPLIYLYGVAKGLYVPSWPVQVVHDDRDQRIFLIGDAVEPSLVGAVDRVAEPTRRYGTRTVESRLHQAAFRQRVLRAYAESCAICRLRRTELLEAAHILPDRHARGVPSVPNGLALCRLHHAAFDQFLIGIRPDYVIDVRLDVLEEHDGPMLEHGLKSIHGQRIFVPRRKADHPNPGYLEERYERFLEAY